MNDFELESCACNDELMNCISTINSSVLKSSLLEVIKEGITFNQRKLVNKIIDLSETPVKSTKKPGKLFYLIDKADEYPITVDFYLTKTFPKNPYSQSEYDQISDILDYYELNSGTSSENSYDYEDETKSSLNCAFKKAGFEPIKKINYD